MNESNEIDESEFSAVLREIEAEIDKNLKAFRAAPEYASLSKETKKSLKYIVDFFATQVYCFYSQRPRDWTDEALDDILTYVFPHKLFDRGVETSDAFFKSVKPALEAFMGYLNTQGYFTKEQWAKLQDALPTSATEMRFIIAQKRKGIDTDDEYFDDDDDDDDLDDDLFDDKFFPGDDGNRGLADLLGISELDAEIIESLRDELNRLMEQSAKRHKHKPLAKSDAPHKKIEFPHPEQWSSLFQCADEIYALKPWDLLVAEDLLIIDLPGEAEPIFCAILGRDEPPGIGIYRGYRAMDTSFLMEGPDSLTPPEFILGFQDALFCYWTPKVKLEPEDIVPVTKLGLKYKGSTWPSFRRMCPGKYPWFIQKDEAEFLAQVLPHILALLQALVNKEISPNFRKNETVIRSYSDEKLCWENRIDTFPDIDPKYPVTTMDNIFLQRQLEKAPYVDMDLEADFVFFPVPMPSDADSPPLMPRFGLVVDADSGGIMGQSLDDGENGEDDAHFMMGLMQAFVQDYGRPNCVYCRNELTASYLADLCEKLNVEILVDTDEGLPMVDTVLEGMLEALQ